MAYGLAKAIGLGRCDEGRVGFSWIEVRMSGATPCEIVRACDEGR